MSVSMMADDFDSDTGVGLKRRISNISDTEVELRSFEEPHSAPLSPRQQSPEIGSATKEGITTVRHGSDCDLESFTCLQKKAKCSSDQENQETDQCESVLFAEGVKEKQGIEEDKLDRENEDVAMKLNDDKVDVVGFSSSVVYSPLVDENHNGFSGIQESVKVNKSSRSRLSGEEVQMDSAVEDCNKGLAESCTSFGENVSDSLLEKKKEQILNVNRVESISDFKSLIANFTDESLVVLVGKHDDGRSGRDEVSHNDSQRQRGGDVKCALKIQVIDDTALIGSVSSASRVAKHMEGNGNKKNKYKETFGNAKKSRRRGKGLKKCSGTNGNESQIVDPQKGCEKKAADDVVEEQKKKWAYSRKEMEALRFLNVEEQKKKWIEIYCGFGPDVTKEYDGLVDCNNRKHIRVDFDPRPLLRKKDATPPILSDEYCENTGNETQSMNFLDPACDSVVQEELIEEEDDDVDDSDEEEEYSSIQRPAFLVTGKPDFDSGPPQDGLEYLRRVRWEAEHIPKVKVAKVERSKLNKEQTVYMPNIPDIARCPDHLLPLKQWEDAFLADFSKLRLALSHYEGSSTNVSAEPQVLPTAVHEQECSNLDTIVQEKFENLTTDEIGSSQSIDSLMQSLSMKEVDDSLCLSSPKSLLGESGPTLSTITAMDSVARVSMLRKRISSVETMSSLSRNDCVWLFALCAAVDTPLNADTCASLRCLLRKCASLRSQKAEMDDGVIMLNILATISGKYFGQSET